MNFNLPQKRLNIKEIQTTKRNIPLEQIISVEGQNPLAQGIETAGNVVGNALAKRAQLREQGEQLAKLESLAGATPGSYSGLNPEIATSIAMNSMKQNQEGKKKILQGTFTDPVSKKVYQPFYDEKTDKIDYQELRGPQVIPPKPATPGTLVQSGLFDSSGQPIMVDNKTGQSKTIALPKGTIGTTQTKTQLTPTSQTRASGEFAQTIIPHISDLKKQIAAADALGYIGPMGGRYADFMTRKVGSTGDADADFMLGKLRTTRDLLATGTMKAHVGNRGGGELLEHFLSDMDTGKQSAAVLQGELDGLLPYMQGYVNAGKGLKTIEAPAPMALPILTGKKKALADKLGL